MPFGPRSASDYDPVFAFIKAGRWSDVWKQHDCKSTFPLSESCKCTLEQLFQIDPAKRPSWASVLNMPWFRESVMPFDEYNVHMIHLTQTFNR
jgi:serine/threonine protein kinase